MPHIVLLVPQIPRRMVLDHLALVIARSQVPILWSTSLRYHTLSRLGATPLGNNQFIFYCFDIKISRYYVEAFQTYTPQQCAQLCLQDAGCLSFDAGVPYFPESGNCFLSYDNRFTNNVTQFADSIQLDYYERINFGLDSLPFFIYRINYFYSS